MDALAQLREAARRIDATVATAKPVFTADPLPIPTAIDTQVGGSHYKDMRIQPIEYAIANNIPFAEGNIIKYVTRWRQKNGVEDLRKAQHMLAILIEFAEKEAQNG